MARATDPALRAQVQRLVPRLVLDRARAGSRGRSGTERLRRGPAFAGGDLDVDASLDGVVAARAEGRPVAVDDLVASRWERPETALCLLVDRSGSMDGPRLVTAAMAAAACALAVAGRGELAVLAFDRRTEVVADLGAPLPALAVVERVLGLRGHGMTSLDAAFRAAAAQLTRARAHRRLTLVLSDCRVTDDLDPDAAGRALDEVLLLPPATDADEAHALARRIGARCAPLERLDDLAPVLEAVLGP